jgi:hypothetical protein
LKETYGSKMAITNTNAKSKGSPIVNLDSIRGCTNNCESCFAKKNSCKSIKYYDRPVPIEKLYGRVDSERYYRFGNFGDPATDWTHTEKLVDKYNIPNTFFVTKLQKLEGFSGVLKNLQISVDPLNKEHFYITLQNIEALLSNDSKLSIILRVRSVATWSDEINNLQDEVVKFANSHGLPILETRVRFTTKDYAITKYELDTDEYSFRRGYLRPNFRTKFLRDVKYHYICDEAELKCKGCENCIKLLNWKPEKKDQISIRKPIKKSGEDNQTVSL